MRYQTKYKSDGGVIKTELVDGLSWSDVVNHLITLPDVAEIVSVKNLRDVPLSEPVQTRTRKRSTWDRMTNA
jgi:hypothetical protein